MYLYGISRLPSVNDGFLYHFTPATSLMPILRDMTLKVSDFTNLNDLNETDICCEWNDCGLDVIRIEQYIIEHCKLISFTQNYHEGEHRPTNVQIGCNHPRMWAQYAANNTGACIVINEQKFIKENEKILKNRFYRFDNVAYCRNLYDTNIRTFSNPQKFVTTYYKHIFFKKYLDWEREHERRFFGIDIPPYLSIQNSIEFICLGRKFINNQDYMKNLTEILIEPSSKCFDEITPHDFALQSNLAGRCLPIQFAHGIISSVKTLEHNAKMYIARLNESGYNIDSRAPMMKYF